MKERILKEKSQLKKNLIYNVGYQILTIFVPLITAPYISRVLGTDGMGKYSFTYTIAQYFGLFIMLGLLNYGNRAIAQKKDNREELEKNFWDIYSVQFFAGIIVIVVYFIYTVFFSTNRLLSFCQSLYLFSTFLDISWFYFGIEKFKLTTSISFFNKIITTVLIFLLVKNSSDIYIYTIIVSSGILINHIIYWLFLHKYIDLKKISIVGLKKHLKGCLILFIPVIAISIYKYMDKIMLGIMTNDSEVGIYEAAEKFINFPLCLITAFGTVMLPRITNMKSNNEEKNIKKYNFISMCFTAFFSIAMAFGFAGISKIFIPLFYGKDFIKSSDVLIVLLPTIVFLCWANVVRTQCLLPSHKDKEFCSSVIFGAIINFIVNLICIPKLQSIGAAIGTVIAEFTVCFVQTIICRKNMDFLLYLKMIIPFIFCGGIMLYVISLISLSSAILTIIVRILLGIIIYFLVSSIFVKRIINFLKK